MEYFYSAQAGGFFCDEIHGENIPPDAKRIAEEQYCALLQGQAIGKKIVCGVNGLPVLADPAPLTAEQVAAQALQTRATLLATAAVAIGPLQDAQDLDIATAAEKSALKSWKQYRVALNRIQLQPGFPQEVDWPVAPQG